VSDPERYLFIRTHTGGEVEAGQQHLLTAFERREVVRQACDVQTLGGFPVDGKV
jgi:hypothetical protein